MILLAVSWYFYVHLWMICFNIYYLSGALQRRAADLAPISVAIGSRSAALRWRAADLEPISVAIVNLTEAIRLKYNKYFRWLPVYYWLALTSIPKCRRACCTERVMPSIGSVSVPSRSNRRCLIFGSTHVEVKNRTFHPFFLIYAKCQTIKQFLPALCLRRFCYGRLSRLNWT